jgi:hypothetical protein
MQTLTPRAATNHKKVSHKRLMKEKVPARGWFEKAKIFFIHSMNTRVQVGSKRAHGVDRVDPVALATNSLSTTAIAAGQQRRRAR